MATAKASCNVCAACCFALPHASSDDIIYGAAAAMRGDFLDACTLSVWLLSGAHLAMSCPADAVQSLEACVKQSSTQQKIRLISTRDAFRSVPAAQRRPQRDAGPCKVCVIAAQAVCASCGCNRQRRNHARKQAKRLHASRHIWRNTNEQPGWPATRPAGQAACRHALVRANPARALLHPKLTAASSLACGALLRFSRTGAYNGQLTRGSVYIIRPSGRRGPLAPP